MSDYVMTVDQQIDDVSAKRPHFVLLGAGASRAALPNGDKNGRQVPLLKEVAQSLMLEQYFPDDLKVLAHDDFEAAYSKLFDLGSSNELDFIDHLVRDYFSSLELPNEPNLYDILLLSLRPKDVIFTFNWDPFLIQAIHRLQKHHLSFNVAKTFFLHGNVAVGYCENDNASGVAGRKCKKCGVPFAGSKLLFPVEHKNYNADSFIRREWDAASSYLKNAAMFTVFGYSAPVTDREAVELLKKAWGEVANRELEQTELIDRPGFDENILAEKWSPFIHSHHYTAISSFYESFLARASTKVDRGMVESIHRNQIS